MAEDSTVDFDAAEQMLKAARIAHEAGDMITFAAARKMVVLSLGVDEALSLELMRQRMRR